ncbi:hypothetical protein AERO9AM_30308 [Aeromicrobium sp. 9AM]|nr:hypothetical protein AERO9AM_30133 [Aeromicrobium sp. 9AM]VXB96581.1 hypothetical protein AERO9AM_30308 [Aeromicrobium sp. 9AM]
MVTAGVTLGMTGFVPCCDLSARGHHIDTSDQPLPGPAEPTLQPAARRRKTPTENTLSAAS